MNVKRAMNTKSTIIIASLIICLLLILLLYFDHKVRKLESLSKEDALEKEVVLTNISDQQTSQAPEPPDEASDTQTTEEQAPPTGPEYTGPIGILKIVSKPVAGAKVYLNGTYFGVTPYMNSSLPVGDYVVSLTNTGYIEYKKKVTIFPFKQRDVIALLITTAQQAAQQNDTNATDEDEEDEEDEEIPEGDGILFKSEPTGAEVKINGVNKGTTPVKIEITEGEYVVKMSKSGYAQYMVFMEISDIGTIESISDEDGGTSTMGDTLFIVEFG